MSETQAEVRFVARKGSKLKTFQCVVCVAKRNAAAGASPFQRVCDDTTEDPVPVFESETVDFSPESFTIEYGVSERFKSQST